MKYTTPDFGSWVKTVLAAKDVKVQALSVETGLLYSYLSRLLNSGKNGKPIQPEAETVEQIGAALVRLGVIESEAEAIVAAGFLPEGFSVVREDKEEYNRKEIEYGPVEEDEAEILRYYRGSPPDMKLAARILLEAKFKEDDEEERAEGRVGKRAE